MKKHFDRDYFGDKTVVVFGFGVNGGGLGTVEFLLGTAVAKIVVTDQKTQKELEAVIAQLPKDTRLEWHLGGHEEVDFRQADIVIKNPGIRWDNPFILVAEECGADILMDSSIFMMLCEAPVIGVTGSKGKTTTASLVAHILEAARKKVVRVGISQTGVLSELAHVTPESIVVFELSSWRLSGLKKVGMSPQVAIITNLYPDHLNYYENMEEYAEDKKVITHFQSENDTCILPGNSEWTDFFSKTKATIKTFEGNDPCAWQDAEALWCWWKEGDSEPTMVLQKEEAFLQGSHLHANMLAALLGCKSIGVDLVSIQKGLKTFRGVAHRFELVRELDGVQYINDTAATIPAASLASLRSTEKKTILLAGGSDKGLPLEPLIQAIEEAKAVILFAGSGTDKLLLLLSPEQRLKCQVAHSMAEAVKQAYTAVQSGELVLLAPGAASFGMFQNEFDRGEQFREAVLAL